MIGPGERITLDLCATAPKTWAEEQNGITQRLLGAGIWPGLASQCQPEESRCNDGVKSDLLQILLPWAAARGSIELCVQVQSDYHDGG